MNDKTERGNRADSVEAKLPDSHTDIGADLGVSTRIGITESIPLRRWRWS